MTLHVFVDRSICEVYTMDGEQAQHALNNPQAGRPGGGAAITSRVFPSDPLKATEIDVFATGASAELLALSVWEMGSMWGEVTLPSTRGDNLRECKRM